MNAPATATKLSNYDFVVVVDTSGSMADPVKAGSTRTRWAAVQETAVGFARDVAALDSDGIDLVFFGGAGVDVHSGVTPEKLVEHFSTRSPRGSTPLAEALQEALKLAGKSDKKDFIVVFTDGVPDDEAAARSTILGAANKQDSDDALTILFVQVGDNAQATKYLQDLDDNLKGAKFDIVDAKTVAEVDKFSSTTDLILAAIDG